VWNIALDKTFTGTLTLNGGYSDVWVFQIGQDLTFSGSVVLTGNAQPCNVFWQVGRDATIAAGSSFVGTLIASRDITLVSGATVNGRLISLNSSLTTDGNTISGPTCAVAPSTPSGSTPSESAGVSFVTVNVVKAVINDNGGTKKVADFPLFVNSQLVISGQSNNFTEASGGFVVTETSDPNYTRTFSGDCDVNGHRDFGGNSSMFCIVTNNDIGAPVVTPPVPPLIDVVKVPSPLALPAGPGLVTYTYTVRNIGTIPMTDVTLVGDTCSPIVLVSGDTNNNNVLDVNETWINRCSTTLSATHTNTVVATGWANGISATDIANATVVVGVSVVPPLIHVTKVPSPLTLLAAGGMVTYTEKITNPGTVALNNVTLSDDKCSPMLFVSGDINKDSKLDVTETWTYTCRTNLTETTLNTAVATGEANGLVIKDYAVATVVVAGVVPTLPNTGTPPEARGKIVTIFALSGMFVLSMAYFIVRKKQTI